MRAGRQESGQYQREKRPRPKIAMTARTMTTITRIVQSIFNPFEVLGGRSAYGVSPILPARISARRLCEVIPGSQVPKRVTAARDRESNFQRSRAWRSGSKPRAEDARAATFPLAAFSHGSCRGSFLELVSKVGVESAGADDAAAEAQQSGVDVAAALVADRESFEGVQPGEGAFDDPAPASEPGAMLGLASGDAVTDTTLAEQAAVLVVVVAAVGDDHRGTVSGPPGAAADGRDAVQ
jgi:hypothetical protein